MVPFMILYLLVLAQQLVSYILVGVTVFDEKNDYQSFHKLPWLTF